MSTPAKKAAKPKKPAAHPKFIEMITKAISTLKERGGSSRQAIEKYIKANYKVDSSAGVHLKMALKRGVAAGVLKQVKGTGASGSFKVAEKKAAKPKKAAKAKKPKSPKKKRAPKKAGEKAAKPKAKKPKSPKKAAKPKKAAAKKPAKLKAKKSPKKKTPKKAKKAAK